MKRVLIFVLGILVTISVISSTKLIATGTWVWSGANDAQKKLLVYQDGDTARFQLELYRGAPSYNSGYIEGTMKMDGRNGVFKKTDEDHFCKITFDFYKDHVTVKQIGEDFECGFGFHVYADGEYKCANHKKPKFYKGDPGFSDMEDKESHSQDTPEKKQTDKSEMSDKANIDIDGITREGMKNVQFKGGDGSCFEKAVIVTQTTNIFGCLAAPKKWLDKNYAGYHRVRDKSVDWKGRQIIIVTLYYKGKRLMKYFDISECQSDKSLIPPVNKRNPVK